MRQLLSRLIGGGGLRQDNFVNAIGESAPIELAYLACRSLVTLVDLQSSENCAESTGSDLKWCHRQHQSEHDNRSSPENGCCEDFFNSCRRTMAPGSVPVSGRLPSLF